ncbi:MAG: hypothetical protein R6T99_01215 [Bacteroidales bacterium]
MKKYTLISSLVFTLILSCFMMTLYAQPHPGYNGDGSGPGGGPIGGGAPIGEGLAILAALGAGYGLKKIYENRKRLDE